jgi:glycerol-3-phosphate dehydrogenase
MGQSAEVIDLLVIGGGINGAGIARDAAGRRLSVTLVEQADLASATSGWSSKLIHGGLRYLEQYEFRLVREALQEREVLLKLAPHIIRPLNFRPAARPFHAAALDDQGGPLALRPSRRPHHAAGVQGARFSAHGIQRRASSPTSAAAISIRLPRGRRAPHGAERHERARQGATVLTRTRFESARAWTACGSAS